MTEKRKSTRRQFLQGRAAADALGVNKSPSDKDNVILKKRQPESYLLQVERAAMACQFAIYLNAGQHTGATEAAVEALDLVEQLEEQMSVFRDSSEISQINREADEQPIHVEPRLFGLLEEAVQLYEATDGAFDITSGTLTKVWGFYRREGRIPSDEELAEAMATVGSYLLQLDDSELTISFLKENVEINLGGIGKGYALDRCVELLEQQSVHNFLIHGGQSSVVACGSQLSETGNDAGWNLGLRHPLRPEVRIAEIPLHNQALGTSGTATQSFYHQGRRYGHILDPRNGQPAEGVFSSTVLAPSAATADALATAFYVMGFEAARTYCQEHENIAAILVTPAKRSGSVAIQTVGLRDDQWEKFDHKIATRD